MKRKQTPESPYFHYYNANPKNRHTGDCVVRALSAALELDYDIVYKELFDCSLKTRYSLASKENMNRYLEDKGWTKQPQIRKSDNTRIRCIEFCSYIKGLHVDNTEVKNAIFNAGGHHVSCIVNNKIYDTWDCSDEVVGNYWVKTK